MITNLIIPATVNEKTHYIAEVCGSEIFTSVRTNLVDNLKLNMKDIVFFKWARG